MLHIYAGYRHSERELAFPELRDPVLQKILVLNMKELVVVVRPVNPAFHGDCIYTSQICRNMLGVL